MKPNKHSIPRWIKDTLSGLTALNWKPSRKIRSCKEVETALSNSEDIFKVVFESANVGKSITLPTGEINVNEALCDMLGYTREELKGKKWQDITPPDEIETTQKPLDSLLQGKKDSVRFNKRYIHKNGSYIWTDVSVAVHRGFDRKPLFFITTIIDNTERIQTEEVLREAYRWWRSTFDATNSAIWILDSEQRVLQSNKTAEKLFQRPYEEFTGTCCWEIVHGTTQPISECPLLRARKSLRRETMELIIGEGWFEVTVDPILDTDGHYAGAVHTINDITKRKRAEEALRESEDLFRNIFHRHTVVKLLVDPENGQIIDANDAAVNFYGWTREQLMSMKMQDINALPLENVKEAMKRVEKMERVRFEFQHRRADGFIRDVEVFSGKFEVKSKVLLNLVINDITDKKRAEEAILMLNEGLEQKINERTAELRKTIAQLEEVNRVFVNRELKMAELKERITELEKK